ncbi:Hypothetical predicted protein [Mytilus galloprovincialis]|uniref:Uncharacterized protein n=1 Tax=Mytilus galloprovincialis TaxID=29158 RepID=A0A8B6H6J4_MYTGA|nr:Hypothetical predicted protein [Mytilus galloprovincialis]
MSTLSQNGTWDNKDSIVFQCILELASANIARVCSTEDSGGDVAVSNHIIGSVLEVEQEKRCFDDLRRVSETTSNRQAGQIVDNINMRVTTQQQFAYKQDYFPIQDSSISKQARLLPPRPRTTFSTDLITNRSVLVSTHLKKDFRSLSVARMWWVWEGGNVVFIDGPEDPPVHGEGPPFHNFRSSSLKKEAVLSARCMDSYFRSF